MVARRLTEPEVTAFTRDGVVCIRDGLDMESVRLLTLAIDSWVASEPNRINDVRSDDNDFPLKVSMSMWQSSPLFQEFVFDVTLAQVAAQLLSTREVFLFNDNMFVKEPGCTVTVSWHHDIPYYPIAGSQLVSLWLPIDSVNSDSGGLRYVAGSHSWGQEYQPVHFTPGRGSYDMPLPDAPDIDQARYDIRSWNLSPRDYVAHHGLTLHTSGANTTDRPRRALALRFAGDDIVWNSRPNAIKIADGAKLMNGERIEGDTFPKVWPRDTFHQSNY